MPVLVTVLEFLEEQGPFGRVWLRYGQDGWQTPAGALDNPDDHRAYAFRAEQRRTAAKAARDREDQAAQRLAVRRSDFDGMVADQGVPQAGDPSEVPLYE
ncbi:hypothetical protein ACWCQL_30100 [Streptomyces sp. NPDC002073]